MTVKAAVLLGNTGTKRAWYFDQGARRAGLDYSFLEWGPQPEKCLPRADEYFIKIDPPVWDSCSLDRLKELTDNYAGQLAGLEGIPGAMFLNRPRVILELLDKKRCKQRLSKAGLPVTEELDAHIINSEQLLEAMRIRRFHQVFVKPVMGSGAAGCAAFRFSPRTGRMALYTCALWECSSSTLMNTKRLRCFTDPREVLFLLDRLLSLDCIVERWYPKAAFDGFSYDLRAVVQEGNVDFLLARLSKGPVTNLHLNNRPLDASRLQLPEMVMDGIHRLCGKALECYPGLLSAGIDILLEKGSLKPRIIEMNAQGDLIYQDIYNENTIYFHQAALMKGWLDGGYHNEETRR